MGDEHWYRNTDWNAEIEAAFNAKLARTRRPRAQYLRIQGSILKDSHPEVAIALLQRCIDLEDPCFTAHAQLEQAHAHFVLGNTEPMLLSLESAMEQERKVPTFGTSAAFDYCMIVALHNHVDRYDRALEILEGLGPGPFPATEFQAEAARAVILWDRDRRQEAREAAIRAMKAESVRVGPVPGFPEVGIIPEGDNPLSRRVREIAAARVSKS